MTTRDEWRQRVLEWRASGQTAKTFAKDKPYSAHSLYNWASQLKVAGKRSESKPRNKQAGRVIQFSRVTVGCDNPDSDTRQESAFRHGHTRAGITIEIDGSRVLVDPGVDRDLLELVTQTLKRSV